MIDNKNLSYIFLFIYIIVGIYLSITNGITSDEYHQQLNWEIHQSAIISFFKNGNYDILLNHGDRYQGVAFNLITQPFSILFSKLVSNLNDLTSYGGWLVAKHIAIFLTFTVSGVIIYFLSYKLTNDLFFAIISSSLYLLYHIYLVMRNLMKKTFHFYLFG